MQLAPKSYPNSIRQVPNDRGVQFCVWVYVHSGLDPFDFPFPQDTQSCIAAGYWRQWLSAVASAEFAAWAGKDGLATIGAGKAGDRVRRLMAKQTELLDDPPGWWPGEERTKDRLAELWTEFDSFGYPDISITLDQTEVDQVAAALRVPRNVTYSQVRSVYWAALPARRSMRISPRSLLLTAVPGERSQEARWSPSEIAALFPMDFDDRAGPNSLTARVP